MRVIYLLVAMFIVLRGCGDPESPARPREPEPAAAAAPAPSPDASVAARAQPLSPLPAEPAAPPAPAPTEVPMELIMKMAEEMRSSLTPEPTRESVLNEVGEVTGVNDLLEGSMSQSVAVSQVAGRESVPIEVAASKPAPDSWVATVQVGQVAGRGPVPMVHSSPDSLSYQGLSAGGTSIVNDAPYDLVFFEHYGVNPFVDTDEDNLSTFALDVDTASYAIASRFIGDGYLPEPDSVRVEEFLNSFDYGYKPVDGSVFTIYVDGAPSIFGSERHRLLRIGLKGREVRAEDRGDANLVFVIDVSGSMARENRLGLVKRSLYLLLDELRDSDSVAVVSYGGDVRVELEPTLGKSRERARRAIENLHTSGATDVEGGLRLGYRIAAREFGMERINRVILLSDGVANVGRTGPDSILGQIQREVDRGITLTTVGFGMGNFNDTLMERLANDGNGTYHYIDSIYDARRLFSEGLTGTLETIAREAKVQVEFNPDVVRSYRLLGYENRDVADEDFRNDDVDAGEIGAGHEVTALYELKMEDGAGDGPLGSVFIRYEDIGGVMGEGDGAVIERSLDIGQDALADEFDSASVAFRKAALVAEFAEILRGSYRARDGSLDAVAAGVAALMPFMSEDADFIEFAAAVYRAREIWEPEP